MRFEQELITAKMEFRWRRRGGGESKGEGKEGY